MVTSPDLLNVPYVIQYGVKYFELVAEPVERELLPAINMTKETGGMFTVVQYRGDW